MTLKDMIEYAVSKASLGNPGEVDAKVWSFAVMALNRQAELIWNRRDWLNSKVVNLAVTTSEQIVTLPDYVDFVMAARIGATALEVRDVVLMNYQSPLDFEAVGANVDFYPLPHAPTLRQPAELTELVFRSENKGDTTQTVRLSGVNEAGVLNWEELVLQGLDPTRTAQRYTEVKGISKEATAGAVSLYAGDEVIARLGARDSLSAYRRVALGKRPEKEITVVFQAKRKFVWMTSNFDVFPVAEAEGAVVDALVAELYEFAGKPELAVQSKAQSEEKLRTLERALDCQAARECRIVPMNPMYAEIGMFN